MPSHDSFSDGFEPSPLPPIATDGSLMLDPAPIGAPHREPISLCTVGPCANYHEMLTKIDAQDPLDGSRGAVHLNVIRTCYPSPGIEMDLATPVRDCNRWMPVYEENFIATNRSQFTKRNLVSMADFETSWGTAEGDDNGDR